MQKRILIIEDEEPVAKYLANFLTREGFTVETAETAEEGVMQVECGEYDLVLLDLTLPDGSGRDVLHELKERNLRIPVLIVTGASPADDRVAECLRLGAGGCVPKTSSVSSLLAAVRRALGE